MLLATGTARHVSRDLISKASQRKVFSNTLSGNEEDVPALSSSAIFERTFNMSSRFGDYKDLEDLTRSVSVLAEVLSDG